MKKTFIFFLGLLIAAGTFSGCNKDSDEKVNQLRVGETTVAIDTLGLYYNGTTTNGHLYLVDICSPTIIVDENGYFMNQGSFIEFALVTSSEDGIATGEYEFEDTNNYSTSEFSFNSSSCYDLDWVKSGSNTYTYLASGTLSIKRNLSNYEFSFDGKDSEGKTVTAYFKGVGTFYDFTKKKSTVTSGKF